MVPCCSRRPRVGARRAHGSRGPPRVGEEGRGAFPVAFSALTSFLKLRFLLLSQLTVENMHRLS